ncbi:hypothetical protein A0H81_13351 [Grifola frondosa]|uniref:Uncharacterized protein n=1 Tax=Grifola frondosa TaxID=5627 RepID=A0A1C7LVE2_GRIFR|nr:hypothetical protein A0H81_13351 [Grifola frondosa]
MIYEYLYPSAELYVNETDDLRASVLLRTYILPATPTIHSNASFQLATVNVSSIFGAALVFVIFAATNTVGTMLFTVLDEFITGGFASLLPVTLASLSPHSVLSLHLTLPVADYASA